MEKIFSKNYIQIPRVEYNKLKNLQKVMEHVQGIQQARRDLKTKRVVPQDDLFKELDI